MANFAGGLIQAFVGPTELGAPDNLGNEITDFIRGAEESLDIAVQELDSEPIAQAIIDASWRGVSVRMFMEQAYIFDRRPPKNKAKPAAAETEEDARERAQWTEYRRPKSTKTNRDIFAALLRNGVNVKADLNLKIFHQKFIVRDSRGSARDTSAVLTGSTNFTRTGTHKNLNHVVIFRDHRISRQYRDEFEEMLTGTFGPLRERHDQGPKTVNVGGVPVRILFAPDHAPELEIIKQMLRCENRVDFAIFTFSGSSGIDDAMTILRAAGRTVRGAMDPSQGRQWWAATDWLHEEGIQLFFPRKASGFGKLHHKLMVIDDAIVVGGSMNYTQPANLYNDENIFVIGSPYDLPESKGGPVDHDACREITGFFRREIDRIIQASDPYVPE